MSTKIVKIVLQNKAEYLFDLDTAEAIIDSDQQLVKITDDKGKWTGEVLNKAYIVSSKIDWEATRDLQQKLSSQENLLETPKLSKEEQANIKKRIKEISESFKANIGK